MASGNPKFGATPVTPLDIGQDGGTRRTANTAFATIEVIESPDEVAQIKQGFPQQNLTAVDVMGFRGKRVVWKGMIRASTPTIMATIESEIEQYRSGRYRDPATGLVSDAITEIQPTLLQRDDLAGGDLVQSPASAVLRAYRRIGPRVRIGPWAAGQTIAVAQEFEIEFEVLGDTEAA